MMLCGIVNEETSYQTNYQNHCGDEKGGVQVDKADVAQAFQFLDRDGNGYNWSILLVGAELSLSDCRFVVGESIWTRAVFF